MNINRHNYETFFLLYVDNELSATERKAVEQFVLENVDLKPELQLLVETTLPADAVSFDLKSRLYKNEVDQEAEQENLLLHLDNELDPIAARKTEAFIAADSSLQQEWKILQQTKLDPNEKIIFENKQLLYRHEKGRVIAVRFWRVAAAAAIIFACLFTGISLLKKDRSIENDTANKTIKPSTEKQVNDNRPDKNSPAPVQTTVQENIASVNNKEQDKTNPTPVIKTNTVPVKNEKFSKDQLVKEEKNILPKTSLENINNPKSNEIIASAVLDKNNEGIIKNKIPAEVASTSIKEKIKAPSAPIIDYNSIPSKPDSYATTVVLNEPSSDNKILYMNEENVARSKLGGLFRKVKRVIERNTNIKTENGVRIGSFEIALNK